MRDGIAGRGNHRADVDAVRLSHTLHYDVLRALDYVRAAGVQPDSRIDEAVAIAHERRRDTGTWLFDVRHRDTLHEDLAGPVAAPNRWITLRALRVLDWYTYGPWPFGRHSTSVSQPHPSRAVDCKRNLNGPIGLDHHTAVEFRRGVAICRNIL